MFIGQECKTKNGNCMVYEGLSGGYDLNTQMIEQAFQLELLSKLEKCKSKEETEAIIAEYEAQRVAALASIFRIILFVVAVLFLVGIVYCVYRVGLYCFNHFGNIERWPGFLTTFFYNFSL